MGERRGPGGELLLSGGWLCSSSVPLQGRASQALLFHSPGPGLLRQPPQTPHAGPSTSQAVCHRHPGPPSYFPAA